MKSQIAIVASVAMAATSANAEKVSPVQKVVQLLGELKVKVKNDLEAETAAMEEYSSYCDDESKNKGFAIETASSEIEDYEAVIESSTAKVSEFEGVIADSGSTIAGKQSELKEAESIRAGEGKDFTAAEKELVDTVDMLGRAANVLERELSFVQGSVSNKKGSEMKKKLGNMVAALGAIVDASWISTAQKKALSSFLEKGSVDSDDDLSLLQASQPQASTKNYESKSGGIVATLHDMSDKAEDQLSELRKAEMKSKFDFQMLAQSLTDSVKNLEGQVDEANSAKSVTEQEKAKAEEDLAKTNTAKSADEKFLKGLNLECSTKASEWDARQKSAADEMAALEKAKEILSSGVKEMFVQTGMKTKRVSLSNDSRQELVKTLRKLSRENNSFALMQMANRAKSDPFVKIRGLVEEMISKLEKQADEEATHEAFCQEEMKKTRTAEKEKNAAVEKHQTRVDKASAGIEVLETEISELNKELNNIAKSNKEATELRSGEKSEYEKASKDYKDSADAVTKAMEVLQEFYGGAAFIQTAQPSFGGSKSDSGNSIVSFLEVAQSDFMRLLSEAEATEAESAASFEKLMQENAVAKATKEASVKGKNSEVQSLKKAVEDSTSDLTNSQTELDAVMEYLDKLKPQCESKAMTYEERKAKRDAEVAGLKSALKILAGEEPALSLIQSKSFLAKARKL